MSHLTDKERRTLFRVLIGFVFVFWCLVFFAVGALSLLSKPQSQDLSPGHSRTTESQKSPSQGFSEVPVPTQKELVRDWYNLGGKEALDKLVKDASSDAGIQSVCTSVKEDIQELKDLPPFPDDEAYGYMKQFILAEENAVSTCLTGDYASANLYQDDANRYLGQFTARSEEIS
jgi:hypothetical protein